MRRKPSTRCKVSAALRLRPYEILRRAVEEALPAALRELWRWREEGEEPPEWLFEGDRLGRATSAIMARIGEDVIFPDGAVPDDQ